MKLFLAILAALGALLACSPGASAAIKVQEVKYKIGEESFRGYLAFDDTITDKRPGILVCHEWWGCNDYARSRVQQLAELGYIAFAVDMFGEGKVTTDPKEAGEWAGKLSGDPKVMHERALAGLKILQEDKRVDTTRLAVIGYCMGGTVALELARTGVELDAVVAFHAGSLAAKNDEDAKSIKGTVLICHGANDSFVKEEDIKKFRAQMEAAKADYIFTAYSGAVHAFTNPDADKFGLPGIKYDEKADRRSWAAMQELFGEVFRPSKKAGSAHP